MEVHAYRPAFLIYNAGMFSSRLAALPEPNRLSRLLEKKRSESIEILDLTDSNPTLCELEYTRAEIESAISSPDLTRYRPLPGGLVNTRAAVVDYYRQRGHCVPIEEIFLTSGTSEAYSFLFKLLADPGDQILVPRPGYPLFDFLARLEGIEPVDYRLAEEDGWHIDMDGLVGRLSSRTRALVVVNPNNPTGSLVSKEQWEQLVNICRQRKIALICDEVFFDYPVQPVVPRFDPAGEERALTFILNGLSKTTALPQLKLSWIVIRGPLVQRREAAHKLEMISDTFLSVSLPAQLAATVLLPGRHRIQSRVRDRVRENLNHLQTELQGTTAQCLPVEAGWYAVIQLPGTLSEEEWAERLLEQENVLVHPGYFYDFEREAFLVLSLLPPPARFREGISRFRRNLPCGL